MGDAWLVCAWCGEQIAAPAELPVGSQLAEGRYQVLGVIGRGGFGITYEAGDVRLKRRVAVKELFPDAVVRHGSMVLAPPHARARFRDARERFLREARVLARFTHPGIVRVYEVFEAHGTAYLVMELLEGSTLVDVLRRRGAPLTEAEVLDVAARVAAALRPVHVAAVLHRDVNPANVMLTAHGRIVVIDFGLARAYDEDRTVGMTRMVTPGYAPLEQYRGAARFGPSTDVYGVAATCYRLATGQVPVSAIDRDGGDALPSPRSLNPEISKAVSDAILDGLELEAAHRPQDLDAFLARLGIARLPDTPTSILLGSPGAQPADLRTVRSSVPLPGLADPGPAVPAPRPVAAAAAAPATPTPPAPPATAVAPRSQEPTEVVAPRVGPDDDATRIVARDRGEATAPPDATVAADGTAAIWPPPPGAPAPLATASAEPAWSPGPGARGRRKVTLPLAAVAVACAMAAPVLVTAAVVLIVLPALATVGDGLARRLRAEQGLDGTWADRSLPAALLAPTRYVRNVVVAVVRTSPVVGVGAVVLGLWYALGQTAVPQPVLDWSLRLIGAATVGGVLASSVKGSARFRTSLGVDELVRVAAPDGRTTERVAIGWIIALSVVAAAIWLTPDPFPLP